MSLLSKIATIGFRAGRLIIILTTAIPFLASAQVGKCGFFLETNIGVTAAEFESDSALRLAQNARAIVVEKSPESLPILERISPDLVAILEYALENVWQHGNEELHSQTIQRKREFPRESKVSTRFYIDLENENLVFRIINKQIKPFPPELEGEFFRTSQISLPASSRQGFTGQGKAHIHIIRGLDNFPTGSSVSWRADGSAVTFTLKALLKHAQ